MPEYFREKEIIAEKSPIIAEFRAKTEEMFHAVPTNYDDFNPSVDAIERAARNYIDFVLQENDLQDEITINDVIISGSRCRGLETDNSDLDILIEYESDSYREDAFFNLLNDTEVNDNLHLGVSVDYNPIRKEETGTLETYLPTVESYLTEKANEKPIETLRDAVDKFFGTDCDKAVTDNGEWRLQIYDGTSENLMNKEIIGVAYHNDEPVCDIHNISVQGFEKNNFQNGCFDVAVGNVPFGELPFKDNKHDTTNVHYPNGNNERKKSSPLIKGDSVPNSV